MIENSRLPSELIDWIDRQLTIALTVSNKEVRRLFHGRNAVFPAFKEVVIDWLPPVAVIRLYQDVDEQVVQSFVQLLTAKEVIESVVIQERGRHRAVNFEIVEGEVPEVLWVEETGLKFQVQPLQFQNFGLFLDMRNGREWLRRHAEGANVLNLFSYTCGFSVAAVAGNARQVVNVDLSKRALATGRLNHQKNEHAKERTQFMPYDMLKSWSRIRKPGPYDIVVIDPPSFQPGSFIALKDYVKVLRRLPELTTENASVMVCHNDPEQSSAFVKDLMAQECPEFIYEQHLAVPEDFAEQDREKSVKVLIYRRCSMPCSGEK